MHDTITTRGSCAHHPCGEASDRVLVERAQRGHHCAFAVLVRRHDARLRAVATRLLRSPEQVDDALQDVYLKAFRTIDRFRGDAQVGTWLYRITYNRCLDELRRRQPLTGVEETLDPPSAEPGPAERTIASMEVTDLLGRLPSALRATMVLVDGLGFDYDAASRALAVPPGTIASRMNRARSRLRRDAA